MLTQEQIQQVIELKYKGYSKNKVAKEMGISWSTVSQYWGTKEDTKVKKVSPLGDLSDEAKSMIGIVAIREGISLNESVKRMAEQYVNKSMLSTISELKNKVEEIDAFIEEMNENMPRDPAISFQRLKTTKCENCQGEYAFQMICKGCNQESYWWA